MTRRLLGLLFVGVTVLCVSRTALAQFQPQLEAADEHYRSGRLDEAIDLYTAVLEEGNLSIVASNDVYRRRSRALLARGRSTDVATALDDQRLTGEKTIKLRVVSLFAPLRVPQRVTGRVIRNETVEVSSMQGKWLWVVSIEGDTARSGWLDVAAVLPPAETDDGVPPIEPTRPLQFVSERKPTAEREPTVERKTAAETVRPTTVARQVAWLQELERLHTRLKRCTCPIERQTLQREIDLHRQQLRTAAP